MTKWGTIGTDEGEFGNVVEVTVDSADNIYASDSGNSRIQKFSETGAFLKQWGVPGYCRGVGLDEPAGLAVDVADNVYELRITVTVESKNSRARVLFVTSWGGLGFR